MIAKVHAAIPYGFEGELVEVEGDMNRGLPAFNIVGMANKTINEAKDRVRSAIVNSGFVFPSQKVTINLAPAGLLKDGAYLDLPIALSVMLLSRQLIESDLDNKLFVGELSLSGEIRPIRGIINIVETAKKAGYQEVYIPEENLAQASLVTDIRIYGVDTLQNLFLMLKHQNAPIVARRSIPRPRRGDTASRKPILDHIYGQTLAKRAMTIAVAGHHNILISGPPGAGKTLLAKVAANLLPDLAPNEIIDITKLYSLAGLSMGEIVNERPFREPHHTASLTAIIGGGAGALPGEISLAHKGILFLDELPEFPRALLEALRQPLEDKTISIARTSHRATYPADFMLVATMNPCPCGYLGDPNHVCKCTELQIRNYQRKLSGPLFDRIDIIVDVEKVSNQELRVPKSSQNLAHDVVKNTITEAILRQRARYGHDGIYNSSLSSFEVSQKIKLTAAAEKILASASEKLNLSARAYFKTIKVAQTIADLEGAKIVEQEHLAEALTYRQRR